MKIRIRVTEADIKNGTRGSSRSCPVALAFKRRLHLSDEQGLHIGQYASWWSEKGDRHFWSPLNNKIHLWIVRFDRKLKVRPFVATLQVGETKANI